MSTLIFLDTEFDHLPDRQGYLPPPQLISIALVGDGSEFYAESDGWKRRWCSDFVRAEVLPHLTGPRMPVAELRQALRTWIEARPGPVVVAADWEGDFAFLLAALGDPRPVNLDHQYFNVVSICDSFVYQKDELLTPYFSDQAPRHHALHDARALRLAWLEWRAAQGGAA